MRFTPSDDFVTALISGVYQIIYSVQTTAGAGASVSLLVNDTVVTNSTVNIVADEGQKTGYGTITLSADDTVAIRIGGAAVTLADDTSAFLSLMRIA